MPRFFSAWQTELFLSLVAWKNAKIFFNPHFSPADYCGGVYIRPDCVMLYRPPQRTIEYDCGGLGRKPCQAGPVLRSSKSIGGLSATSLRNPVENEGSSVENFFWYLLRKGLIYKFIISHTKIRVSDF